MYTLYYAKLMLTSDSMFLFRVTEVVTISIIPSFVNKSFFVSTDPELDESLIKTVKIDWGIGRKTFVNDGSTKLTNIDKTEFVSVGLINMYPFDTHDLSLPISAYWYKVSNCTTSDNEEGVPVSVCSKKEWVPW